ncbi:MAG TPA: SIR2 family protein, partial [Anaerolineae bacterium]|nr:SIR2 family protein [Anaerolineae bacterium]
MHDVSEVLHTHTYLLQEMSAGNAVLFCGAGVSHERYPTWNQLVQELASEAGLPADNADHLDVLQWYVEARGRAALEQHLARLFDTPARPTDLQRTLVRFPWDVIFTTNYDRLLERAFHEQGREVDVVVEDTQVGRVTERSRATLVKMHGCVSRPHSMIVTREDYDDYEIDHPATITYLQSLLSTRTFLFVGFSLRDPNFRAIYRIVQQVLGSFRRYAYAIMLQSSVNEYVLQYWRRQRLLILPIASPREVKEFMAEAQQIATGWAARRSDLPTILRGLGAEQAELEERVAELARAAAAAYERIRLPLLGEIRERGDGPPAERVGALLWSQTSAAERQQLYSLHNLLQLLEEIGVTVPARQWLRLGNTLYELEKWDLALQAYQRVYRRIAQGGWHDPSVQTKEIAGDLARCYLSVAQERLEAFRRISVDKSMVLDLAEYEWAEGHLARCILAEDGELDRAWLARRPSDLAEYGYVNNRLAEIEMARGRLDAARLRLHRAVGYQEAGRDLYAPPMGRMARAYALNHLGKGYRLRTEIAVTQGRIDDASHHFAAARRALLAAIDTAPALGYPCGHLFDLLRLVEEKGLEQALCLSVADERAALRRQLEAMDDEEGYEVREWLGRYY